MAAAASKMAYLFSLLFLVSLGTGEMQFAKRVPQLLHHRESFLGGISLYAETPDTGEDGVCPSYTQDCPDSCCPDGCCPIGTFCFVNGDYCCPTDTDCSSLVDSIPSCANSSWIMYARPAGAVSPYFCCEPDQIAILPNQCIPNNGTVFAASVLLTAATAVGTVPASSSISAESTSTKSETNSITKGSSIATGGSSMATGGSSMATGTSATGKGAATPSPTTGGSTATSSAISTTQPKSIASRNFVASDWLWGMTALVVALGFSMRLLL